MLRESTTPSDDGQRLAWFARSAQISIQQTLVAAFHLLYEQHGGGSHETRVVPAGHERLTGTICTVGGTHAQIGWAFSIGGADAVEIGICICIGDEESTPPCQFRITTPATSWFSDISFDTLRAALVWATLKWGAPSMDALISEAKERKGESDDE